MEIKEFIEKFAEAVDIEEFDNINAETNFRELDEWSSLAALSVIAMFDEEYDKTVNGAMIRECNTVGELAKLAE